MSERRRPGQRIEDEARAEAEAIATAPKQPKVLEQGVVDAFDFLTGKVNFADQTLEELYLQDASADVREVALKDRRATSANVLYMSELLIGSRYSDVGFMNDLIEKVDSLPAEKKPDALVMSGLVQGDFRHKLKNRRPSLQAGLETMDAQFYHGRKILDKVLALDIPLVYSMGDDDLRICEEMTYEAFMQLHAKASERASHESADDSIKSEFNAIERAKSNSRWPEYYRFTVEAAFPYCLRAGRTLRTADMVAEYTEGEYNEPEREILFDAYRRAAKGQRLTAKHYRVLDRDALKDTKNFVITDDFNHDIATKGQVYLDRIRHNLGLSPTAMVSNYFTTPRKLRGIMEANGDWDTANLITMHNQEASGLVMEGNSGIHSIGGMQNPMRFLDEKGHITASSINPIRRQVTTRRRIHAPNATSIERTDDGRQIITIYNKALWEKSESIPERTAIMMQCDWQAGSLSARPDYQIKQLDMMRRKLGEMPVILALGGDMLHGRNYSDFPRESGRTGLMGMDQQTDFVKRMIRQSLEEMTKDEVSNMLQVLLTTGNHEWNSGTLKWHGYSFIDYIEDAYKDLYSRHGYKADEIEKRVQFQDTLVTPTGEPFKTYSTLGYVGDMGIEVRHFFGGGGGTGGRPPAFMAHDTTVGAGNLKKDIDIQIFGHYHHPSYMVGNNKLFVGSGALAGITGFEYERGMRSVNSVVNLYVGGGLPPQIEFISEEGLINHKIKDGPFSDKRLREQFGHRNDSGFNAHKHGIYLDKNSPKSALQKRVLELGHMAAFSSDRSGSLVNPNK